MAERVVLIRHGETEWTLTHRHTGRTDIPLTAKGREEARLLGELLAGWAFDLVLASPLSRAEETARLAGFAALIDLDLAEWDYGIYEGERTADTRQTIPGWSVWTHEIIEGESLEQLGARCDRVLERLSSVAGDAALFGHGHALRVLAARWLHQNPGFGAQLVLSTASISVLGFERETAALIQWNQTLG